MGGAIEARRIRTFRMLTGVVCHREKRAVGGAAEGQIYFFARQQNRKTEKVNTGTGR